VVIMEEKVIFFVGTFIIIIIVLLAFFYIINHFTGGKLVRLLVCSILFWVPFGAAAAQYCQVIPV
jgi:hypothetical protein